MLRCLYHNHPVKIDIAGTVESIAQIDAELLYKCYYAFYDLNNMVLTAAGIAGGEDVYNTIKAGADATGSSSGVAKAKDRPAMIDEMISALRKAWDERTH